MAARNLFQRAAPLLFVLLWSTGFVGAKYGLPYAEPLTFLSVRYGLVVVLMAALALATCAPWPQSRVAVFHIGVSGVLMHAVYLGGIFTAVHRGLPAGVVALVAGMQPLLTALGAGVFLGERVSARQWIGLILGFAGVALVVDRFAMGGAGTTGLEHMLPPAFVALGSIAVHPPRLPCPSAQKIVNRFYSSGPH